MEDKIILRLLQILCEFGKIPEKYVESEQIRQEFKELLDRGVTKEDAKQTIADKHFKSFDTIEDIIYRRERRYVKKEKDG